MRPNPSPKLARYARTFGTPMHPNPDQVLSQIRAMKRPAIHLRASSSQSNSRIGGLPDVPATFAWPQSSGGSQSFVAQIDLAEVNPEGLVDFLPRRGRILFFYDCRARPWGFDPADRGGWAVIYLAPDDTASLRPATAPADLVRDDLVFPAQCVAPVVIESLPSIFRVLGEDCIPDEELPEDTLETYCSELHEPLEGLPDHRMGGYPTCPQSDTMEQECQLVSNGIYCGDSSADGDPRVAELLQATPDWQLLLQIDTSEDAGMMWGDAGLLYYWIPRESAVAHRFSDTWLCLQCS